MIDEERGQPMDRNTEVSRTNEERKSSDLVDRKGSRSKEKSQIDEEAHSLPTEPELGPRPAETLGRTSNLVEWDGPDDKENPQNWSKGRKVWITTICALMIFIVSFGSSIFSTATVVTAEEFGVSEEVMILGVTLYVLGFACGPLVWGPLSELHGRRNPLMVGLFGFIVFQIPVGLAHNIQTLLIGRFFAGAFGVATFAIIGGIWVDMFDAVARGIATNAMAAATYAGPTLGPVVGQFTIKNKSLGWRWTAWIVMIITAVLFLISLPTLPETWAPILLKRKAARLRKETGNEALRSKLDEEPVNAGYLLQKYGFKPTRMIVQEPILMVITLYVSLVYGLLYLIFFAFPISFQFDRHMEFGVASLPFLAVFVGSIVACIALTLETLYNFTPKLQKSKKIVVPEERLIPMMAGSVILVIGLFWFAWTSFPSINPWPQILSGVLIGCGIAMVFFPSLIYLIDVYLLDANSALSANTVVRSLVACAFPLFAGPMFRNLGTQWASTLLAFLCLALVPAPFLFYRYGQRIRSWSRYAFDLG